MATKKAKKKTKAKSRKKTTSHVLDAANYQVPGTYVCSSSCSVREQLESLQKALDVGAHKEVHLTEKPRTSYETLVTHSGGFRDDTTYVIGSGPEPVKTKPWWKFW